MATRLELVLDAPLTLGDVEAWLAQAKKLGAEGGAPVTGTDTTLAVTVRPMARTVLPPAPIPLHRGNRALAPQTRRVAAADVAPRRTRRKAVGG